MASTFHELYSDFIDQVNVYVEKLNVTHLMFMRYYTQGMQKFQRRTEYMETVSEVTLDSNDDYILPNSAWRIIEIRDGKKNKMLMQGFQQLLNNVDQRDATGRVETPIRYAYRGGNYDLPLVAFYGNRQLIPSVEPADDKMIVYYVPDMDPISRRSPRWSDWFPIEDNFEDLFMTAAVTPQLAFFETAFTQYAIAEYLKTQGSKNFMVFEKNFNDEVLWAIENKPLYNRENMFNYYMSPWS